SVTIAAVRDDAGHLLGFAKVTRDISERHRAEVAIRDLNAQLELRLQRLAALRRIDAAITSGLDLRLTLDIVLDHVTMQLGVHAAAILLLDPHAHTLGYAAGRGFRGAGITHSRLRLGEDHAGRAALERRLVTIPDLSEDDRDSLRAPLMEGEGL